MTLTTIWKVSTFLILTLIASAFANSISNTTEPINCYKCSGYQGDGGCGGASDNYEDFNPNHSSVSIVKCDSGTCSKKFIYDTSDVNARARVERGCGQSTNENLCIVEGDQKTCVHTCFYNKCNHTPKTGAAASTVVCLSSVVTTALLLDGRT